MLLKVFNDVLSRVFLGRRDSNSRSPSAVRMKESPPGDDQSTNTTSGESLANQRDCTLLVTVLDRLFFTLSVAAVFAAIVIFFPR